MKPQRYFVRVDMASGVRGVLCARPYPREDHIDAHGWASREDAERFAAKLGRQFPENSYWVSDD